MIIDMHTHVYETVNGLFQGWEPVPGKYGIWEMHRTEYVRNDDRNRHRDRWPIRWLRPDHCCEGDRYGSRPM